MNNLPVEETPIVLATSIELNSIAVSVRGISLGGIICVTYPKLSWSKESFLNPEDTSDLAPKFELEFV